MYSSYWQMGVSKTIFYSYEKFQNNVSVIFRSFPCRVIAFFTIFFTCMFMYVYCALFWEFDLQQWNCMVIWYYVLMYFCIVPRMRYLEWGYIISVFFSSLILFITFFCPSFSFKIFLKIYLFIEFWFGRGNFLNKNQCFLYPTIFFLIIQMKSWYINNLKNRLCMLSQHDLVIYFHHLGLPYFVQAINYDIFFLLEGSVNKMWSKYK